MIAPSMVDEVRRLLSEGRLSQRAIARRTGISRGTVAAIASGRRPAYGARRRAAPGSGQPYGGGLIRIALRLERLARRKPMPP
jgi:transcriptional regulator with XRE-family HTH domain